MANCGYGSGEDESACGRRLRGLGAVLLPRIRRGAVLAEERFEFGSSCFGGSSRRRLPFGPGLGGLGPRFGGLDP